jgi:hypothetical protein
MPRPKLKPTEEQRKQVKAMIAVGIKQEDVARMLGIKSAKTLRKYFRKELDQAAISANVSVGHALYKMAVSGEYPAATIFWLKSQAHWREQPTAAPVQLSPPPFVVARDEGGSDS